MIKICFITTISGTLESFVLELAKYLHEKGKYEITFICNPDKKFEESLPEYIRFIPVKMRRGISLNGIGSMLAMTRIFKREKFDLVQYSTPNAACYASIASWLAKVPVRLYCQWGIVYVGFSGLKRKLFKLEEHMVCRLSTWIEPDSFGNLNFSHNEGLYPNDKGSVVWNGSASGVSLSKFDIAKKEEYRNEIRNYYDIPESAMVFGFVGRITGDKGINELFDAFRRIYYDNPTTYLILVGNPEKADSVDVELYNWANKCDHVIFVGYTNEVEKYVSAMDTFVLPSYREGFGLGVVEAEAMGVPVIVSDIPGPTDAMINNCTGLIIEKKNTEHLLNAMLLMINDTSLRHRLATNAVKFAADNFDQNRLFQEIEKDRLKLLGGEGK